MTLSIIIPTYNRSEILEKILRSLYDQTDPDFEVIVAIDNGSDETPEMLETLQPPYRLKSVETHCKTYGLAVARNLGALHATGDIIAIIDDDSYPVPGYVEACKAAATRGTITGGPRAPLDPAEARQSWKMQELAKLPPLQPMKIDDLREHYPTAIITECNIAMLREDFLNMGMFSERLKRYGFIGQEFFARAIHLGLSYQYAPRMGTIHDRQIERGSGMNDARKRRDIKIATAMRDSFMTPEEFEKQIEWAKAAQAIYPSRPPLPAFPVKALALFPFRFARNRLGDIRRSLKRKMA